MMLLSLAGVFLFVESGKNFWSLKHKWSMLIVVIARAEMIECQAFFLKGTTKEIQKISQNEISKDM